MKVKKEAKLLKSNPPDKLFLAAVLRRASQVVTPAPRIEKIKDEAYKKGQQSAKGLFKLDEANHQELKNTIEDFERISGVRISKWDRGDIAQAVKMIVNGEHLAVKQDLARLLVNAEEIVKSIKSQLGG